MIKIAQISDIQVRNFQRHEEFKKSFENLYKSLNEHKPDYIVLPGDIAHSKTHISPELVSILSGFLRTLADIAPLIVIPGNHDGNLNDLKRMDALTPIVEALNHPNLYYYKYSGVYEFDDVNFVVFSCFDEDWPTEAPPGEKINVGIYHGMVKGAILQNGIEVIDCPYELKEFLKISDFLLMGDIHRMQILDFNYRAAYCGSLVQQNFGEGTTKGYLMWDIRDKNDHDVDFIELPNICPFYTLRLPDDLTFPDASFQSGARIRVHSRQLTIFEKQSIEDKVRTLYEPSEVHWKDEVNAHRQELKVVKGTTIEDLRNVAIQEKLIKGFLESYDLSDKMLESIYALNKKCDSAVNKEEEVVRNVEYFIRKVKWSNIFSYGENNEFDFSIHPGIVGIFGKNGTGKSSLAVDIPLYLGWNTNSKGVTKNDEIINDRKSLCYGEMEIAVGEKIYNISRSTHIYEKSGKKKGKPVFQGKTDVDLDITHEDGTIQSKKGEERRVTDDLIRRTLGSAEDFLATSVAPQWKLLNFIEKGGTERQRTIGKYFDIDIFQKKHKLAKDGIKETKGALKAFGKIDFEKDKRVFNDEICRYEECRSVAISEIERYNKSIQDIEEKVSSLANKIINVNFDDSITPEFLDNKILQAKIKCLNKKNEVDNISHEVTMKKTSLDESRDKLKEFGDDPIISFRIIREKNDVDLFSVNQQVSDLAAARKMSFATEKRLDELEKYGCTSNVDCCMLDDLNRTKDQKEKLIAEIKDLEASPDRQKIIKECIEKNKIRESLHKEVSEYHNKSLSDLKNLESQHKSESEILSFMVSEVKKEKEIYDDFTKNKEQVNQNAILRQEMEVLNKGRFSPEESIFKSEARLRDSDIKIAVAKENLSKALKDQAKYNTLKEEYEATDYYIQAMSKDGISRFIIAQNLDIINREIEKILFNKVVFNVELKMDEKGKEVEIYFKHPNSKPRRIELTSGMEKTISAIAIRAAMISVTTLPKANVFILDEVFASLDPEYVDAMGKILEYLKGMFESVIIITHIEEFKDLVDHVVSIDRDDAGFSRVTQ